MSSKDQHPSKDKDISLENPGRVRITVIVSDWNNKITDSLLEACVQTLAKAGIKKECIMVHRVPGAFELALAAKWSIQTDNPDAVICLGCVITGETKHDIYISQATAQGIMQLGLMANKPVIFGVLTPNTMEQALERAGGKYGNKGQEAAQTAIEMLALKSSLGMQKQSIGFGS